MLLWKKFININKISNKKNILLFGKNQNIKKRNVATQKKTQQQASQQQNQFQQKQSQNSIKEPLSKNNVIIAKDVEINNIAFGKPQLNKRGGQFIPISYPPFPFLRVQSPVCRVPFGVSILDTTGTGNPSYSLQISFDDLENNEEMKNFYEFITKLDELTITTAQNQSSSWFPGKKLIPEVIRYNFRPSIKLPKDPKYSPLLKFKIPFRDNMPIFDVYKPSEDNNLEKSSLDAIQKNCRIILIFDIRNVWFMSNQYGINFQAFQAKVVDVGNDSNTSAPLPGPAFI
jgi:hypothetical protein